jgi:hypothetical protein
LYVDRTEFQSSSKDLFFGIIYLFRVFFNVGEKESRFWSNLSAGADNFFLALAFGVV